MGVPELQSGTFLYSKFWLFFPKIVGMKKNFVLTNAVNCPYVFNFRPYAFFRCRFFPKFQTFNTKSEPPNAKILHFGSFFSDVSGDLLWVFHPIFIWYMASFFRQIKIRVLTLSSRKSNEKIKIFFIRRNARHFKMLVHTSKLLPQ